MTLKVMNDNNINILSKEDATHYYTLSGYTKHFISSDYGSKFDVTLSGLTVNLGSGQGTIYGRHVVNDGETKFSYQLPINSDGYLVLSLDLTKPAGSEVIFTSKSLLATEDLSNRGMKYDLPLYRFTTNATTTTRFEDIREYYTRELNTDRIADKAITENKIDTSVLLKVYPVGAIYISTVNTNPGTLFGGTWVTYAAGRTLVGVDVSQTEFNTVQKTGGAKTHTLDISQMPSHNHNYFNTPNNTGTYTVYVPTTSAQTKASYQTNMTNTGGGQAHNNLQPYITVYIWRRTA